MKILLIPFFLFFALGFNCGSERKNEITADTVSVINQEKDTVSEYISVVGVGDIMLGSNYPTSSSLPPNDGETILDDVKDILADADITTGNLEGCFLDKGGTPKDCGGTGENCHSFRMPTHYAGYLKNAGFDYLSVANNHSGDMGKTGRESTYNTLNEYGIAFSGTEDYPYTIIESRGKKIGIAGFAPNRGCVDIRKIREAKEIISELKSKSDIVIVWFHGGAEGSGAQHVTKKSETYMNENRGNVYEFAHSVIDAGADLVFGSGPHVTRAVELYKGKFIAYSLGNFCTYGKFGLGGQLGITPIIKVYINGKGDFVKAEITSVKQIKKGIPVTDESGKAFTTLQKLTEADFPETELIFEGNEIKKK